MSKSVDLWGDFEIKPVRTPRSILIEQAVHLQRRVGDTIKTRVVTRKFNEEDLWEFDIADGNIGHALQLTVPALDNYVLLLLRVFHNIHIYPCFIVSTMISDKAISCPDEDSLLKNLGAIFQNSETRKIILSLLSQAAENKAP